MALTQEPLRLLYRGRLGSCNYDCGYCPFAKHRDNRDTLAQDRRDLERFVAWISHQTRPIEVLFTPWGEALIRPHYQQAIRKLCALEHVHKVAIQTNLSLPLPRLLRLKAPTLALWCSWHPTQVTLEKFLHKCRKMHQHGIRFSVGAVAGPQSLDALRRLREALPPAIYFWINLDRDRQDQLTQADWTLLRRIDPLIDFNAHPWPSRGHPCRTGSTVLSVNGDGNLQRCHFVPDSLGNLYDNTFQPTHAPCPNDCCDCHIGYVHMPELKLYERFTDGVLERIPEDIHR